MRPIRFASLTFACVVAALYPAYGDSDYSKCEGAYAAIGLPQIKNDGSEYGPIAICRKGYAVAFNPETRSPDWVIEQLLAFFGEEQ